MVGALAHGTNAGLSALEGEYGQAGLSLLNGAASLAACQASCGNPNTAAMYLSRGVLGVSGAVDVYQAGQSVNGAYNDLSEGNYLGAALNLASATMNTLGALSGFGQFFRACFAAGTPLRTPDGSKPIEQFKPGDLVLSRSEHDPDGPIEAQVVEETFTTKAFLSELTVSGHTIKTTAEHPFWVRGKGWTECKNLKVGDSLAGEGGRWLEVEAVRDTGEFAAVYNMRVAEYHTYFVGNLDWGFDVWAHNAKCGYRVMSNEEYDQASQGNWGDSLLVKGSLDEEGRKWLWRTKVAARRWLGTLTENGETGLRIAKVPTAQDIRNYPKYPHPPQGTAYHVPTSDLGPASPFD